MRCAASYSPRPVGTGLSRASYVLVVADGALWIWNLVNDRFPKARQRLDLYLAKKHLWALAGVLHGAGTPAPTEWVQPLLRQLETDQSPRLINKLRKTLDGLGGQPRVRLQVSFGYLENNLQPLHYLGSGQRNEPPGNDNIVSSCRQYQCPFKRPRQFWSTSGD
jgi:hypothetical protein